MRAWMDTAPLLSVTGSPALSGQTIFSPPATHFNERAVMTKISPEGEGIRENRRQAGLDYEKSLP